MTIPSALPLPVPIPQQDPPRNAITTIAIECLKELALSLTLSAGIACFVPSPAGIGLVAGALLIQTIASLFFHSLNEYVEGSSFCDWALGANFALLIGLNVQTLIHELGHVLAALALYKRASPTILIDPFSGGLTQFYKTSLTSFGQKIGPAGATCLVILSGPGFALLISSALLLIGLAMKEKYPRFSKYLISWSLLDFFNHAHYAYSAHWTAQTKLNHDFIHLSVFGLNPTVASVAIVAIPVMMIVGMYWVESQPQEMQLA
jgi:hypothetical protein